MSFKSIFCLLFLKFKSSEIVCPRITFCKTRLDVSFTVRFCNNEKYRIAIITDPFLDKYESRITSIKLKNTIMNELVGEGGNCFYRAVTPSNENTDANYGVVRRLTNQL